jgi:hypothetical protein
MRTNNKEIINEIHQIRRMMGLKTNNNLLTEAVVGGGILDDIIGLLAKKTPDDLLALGFKNAEEVLTFVREFPTSSITRQSEIVGDLIVKLGDSGLTNLTKQLLDDTNTYIGGIVSDRVSVYEEMAKKYPNVTPDEFVKSMKEDMLKTFQGANPNVQSLVKKIEQESGERVRSSVGKNVESAEKEAEELAQSLRNKLEMNTKLSDQFKTVKLQIEGLPSFKALTSSEKTTVRKLLESWKDKTPKLLFSETDAYISKILGDPSRVKSIPLKDRNFLVGFKNLLMDPKKLVTIIGSGLIITIVALIMTGNIGKAKIIYDENKKSLEDANATTGNCPGNEKFIEEVELAMGKSYDPSKLGDFDTKACTGTYDGVTYEWNGTSF